MATDRAVAFDCNDDDGYDYACDDDDDDDHALAAAAAARPDREASALVVVPVETCRQLTLDLARCPLATPDSCLLPYLKLRSLCNPFGWAESIGVVTASSLSLSS